MKTMGEFAVRVPLGGVIDTVGSGVTFEPLAQLPVKGEAVFKVKVKGTQAGDSRIRIKLACDQIKTAVSKEENTRFYKE